MLPFLPPENIRKSLKTSENLWFSGVFKVYKMRTVARNGLGLPVSVNITKEKKIATPLQRLKIYL